MGFEPRGINPVPGPTAESDVHYTQYVYNDVSNSLTIGMPVFVDIRDSAEFNQDNTTTAVSPTIARTGKNVVLGTTAAGTGPNYICVGVFAPQNPAEKPQKGDAIRVCDRGEAVASVEVYNAGTALKVGDVLIVDTTPGVSLVSGHNTPVANQTVGVATATGTAVASQNTIQATGGGNVTVLANAFIRLT